MQHIAPGFVIGLAECLGAQDAQSSVVFGMPGEAIRLGAAEYVLSPERIVGTIRSLVTRS